MVEHRIFLRASHRKREVFSFLNGFSIMKGEHNYMFDKFFRISEKGSTVKTELLAGLTTFLTMAYILAVNPGIMSDGGMPFSGAFLATALAAGFSSILMGVYANYPVALASGMGLNAFFTYTVVFNFGLSWQAALAAVFISGILFLVISLTGVRKIVINAIPAQLKLAIGAGIGFFIAFIGLKNAGIVVSNPDTYVALGNFTAPAVALALFGIVVTVALLAKKVKAGVFLGMVITALVGVALGLAGVEGMPALPMAVFSLDLDFSTVFAFTSGFEELFASPKLIVIIVTFLFVDFFDTAGTLVAVANRTNLINKDGELENVDKALTTDAIGTIVGAALGTSTVTSYIESASGVEVGGRTGLTAVTTGVLFLVAIVFAPILAVVNSTVTAPALVIVGILMAQQLGGVNWDDFTAAASGFVAVIMMVLSFSISDGIALGFITYAVVKVASGKAKDVNLVVWLLLPLFIIHYILK